MEIEERRKHIADSFELMKSGKSRSHLFEYLLAKGFEKLDVSNILTSNEERIQRQIDIKKAETDLSLPLLCLIGGIALLFVGKNMMFIEEGYILIGALPILVIFIGAVLTLAGLITFILKLRNRLVKK